MLKKITKKPASKVGVGVRRSVVRRVVPKSKIETTEEKEVSENDFATITGEVGSRCGSISGSGPGTPANLSRPQSRASNSSNLPSTPSSTTPQNGAARTRPPSQQTPTATRIHSNPPTAFIPRSPSIVGSTQSSDSKVDSSVRVCVRFRPLAPTKAPEDNTLEIRRALEASQTAFGFGYEVKDNIITMEGVQRSFPFERVFLPDATTEKVYEEMGQALVDNVLEGFNATIFAYGQTNSGKTHTMFGDQHGTGLIEYAMQRLFSRIESMRAQNSHLDVLVHLSFMEIYNEEVRDLLAGNDSPDQKHKVVFVKDQTTEKFVVPTLTEKNVGSARQVLDFIAEGSKQRQSGQSHLNVQSSRSHAIFRLEVQSGLRQVDEAQNSGGRRSSQQSTEVKISELNIVDLAGSETLDMAGTVKQSKETKEINRSLSALKTVIQRLTEQETKGRTTGVHIPFRDSTLTKILKNSLGGNAKTAVICAVSPAPSLRKNTLRTFDFGCTAALMQNKAVVNKVVSSKVKLRQYQDQIRQLESELNEYQAEQQRIQDHYRSLEKEIQQYKIREASHAQLKSKMSQVLSNLVVSDQERQVDPTSISMEDMSRLERELNDLKSQNQMLSSQLSAQAAAKEEAEAQQRTLLQKMAQQRREKEEVLKQLEMDLHSQSKAKELAEDRERQLMLQLKEQKTQQDSAERRFAELEQEKLVAEQEQQNLLEKLGKKQKAKKRAETQLNETKDLLDKAEAEKSHLLEQLSHQQSAKDDAQRQQTKLKAQLEEQSAAIQEATAQREELASRLAAQQRAARDAQKEMSGLSDRLATLTLAKEAAEKERQEVQKKLAAQAMAQQEAEEQRKALLKHLKEQEQAHQRAERQQQVLSERLAEQHKASERNEEHQRKLLAQLDEQKQAQQDAEAQRRALKEQLKQSKSTNEEIESQKELLRQKLEQQAQAQDKAQKQNQALLAQLSAQENARQEAERQQHMLASRLVEQRKEATRAQQQLEQAQANLEEIQRRQRAAEEQAAQSRLATEAARQACEEALALSDQMMAEKEAKEAEIDLLKDRQRSEGVVNDGYLASMMDAHQRAMVDSIKKKKALEDELIAVRIHADEQGKFFRERLKQLQATNDQLSTELAKVRQGETDTDGQGEHAGKPAGSAASREYLDALEAKVTQLSKDNNQLRLQHNSVLTVNQQLRAQVAALETQANLNAQDTKHSKGWKSKMFGSKLNGKGSETQKPSAPSGDSDFVYAHQMEQVRTILVDPWLRELLTKHKGNVQRTLDACLHQGYFQRKPSSPRPGETSPS